MKKSCRYTIVDFSSPDQPLYKEPNNYILIVLSFSNS